MNSKMFILSLAFCLFSVAFGSVSHPSKACRDAYYRCDFRFVGPDTLRTFYIGGPPDVAFTPRIISRNSDELLGVLNSNNITPEFINEYGGATPITSVPAQQPFTPTHFKPYTIKYTPYSGIGHQTFHLDQKDVARSQCVRVWFSEYQILKSVYPLEVKENKNNVPKSLNKCVVFYTS